MAVRPVVLLPERVLKTPCEPIGQIDDRARELAQDLIDTMRASPHSVGLAANQIGVSLRAFCIDVTGHRKAKSCHGEVVLFDPVVIERGDGELAREGCMSVPDLTGDVRRATSIVVRGMTPEGEQLTIDADAFEARALQHELDHLDGLLFLDRVASHESVFRRRVYR